MAKDLTYNNITTDVTLSGDNDRKVPSEKATKAYVDNQVATKESVASRSRIVGTAGQITVSNNSGSVFATSNITVSLSSTGDIIAGSNMVVAGSSKSVVGGNVTVSLDSTVSIQAVTVSNKLKIPFGTVSTQTSAGETGTIQYNVGNLFVCVGTNNWQRAATTTTWE